MEIHGPGRAKELANLLFGVQDSAPTQPSDKRQSESKSESSQSDTVSISLESRALRVLTDLVKATEPSSAQRTAQLKEAIDNGTYSVDGRTTADALIRNVLTDSVL